MKLPRRDPPRTARAPVSRAETGAYPSDWGLRDFPHPNPYFPSPPRRMSGRVLCWSMVLLLGVGVALVGGWLVWYLLPGILKDNSFKEGYATASIAPYGLLLAFYAVRRLRAILVWRKAQLVPAFIEVVHAGVPLPTWTAMVAGLAPGFLGTIVVLIIELFFACQILVTTVERGHRTRRTIRLHRNQTAAARGDMLWIAASPSGHCVALWDLALDSPHAYRLPLNAKSWFNDALVQASDSAQTDDHDQLAIEQEMAQAAKANTRAMKRAGRG